MSAKKVKIEDMVKKTSVLFFLILSAFILTFLSKAHAFQEDKVEKAGDPRYKEATYKNLSKLYWHLNRLDIDNDLHIDNFMLINECDIYTDYSHNEFQWREIQKTARKALDKKSRKFSPRMKFVQPLKLGDYNLAKGGFDIVKKSKVNEIRRFEIRAIDFKKETCSFSDQVIHEGYPKGILAELSRPIDLKVLPMAPDVAREYIRLKTIELDNESVFLKPGAKVEDSRQVYIVMFVRFFSSVGEHYSQKEHRMFAKLLGVLEKIEVYDDLQLTKLLYSQNYTRSKRSRNDTKNSARAPTTNDVEKSVEKSQETQSAVN